MSQPLEFDFVLSQPCSMAAFEAAAAPAPPELYTSKFTGEMERLRRRFPTLLTIPPDLPAFIVKQNLPTEETNRLLAYLKTNDVFVLNSNGSIKTKPVNFDMGVQQGEFILPQTYEEFEEMRYVIDACIVQKMTPIDKYVFNNDKIRNNYIEQYYFQNEIRLG